MSEKNLQEFCELVLRDAGLQKKFMKHSDRDEFLDEIISAGEELGFVFSRADVIAQMHENKGLWNERWM